MEESMRTATARVAVLMLAGSVAVLGAAVPHAGAVQRKLLVSKVTWIDSANQTGTMLFQGEVVDGALSGRAYATDGSELVVTGTVSGAGGVSGALALTTGESVGTFTSQLNAAEELEGGLYVDGTLSSAWVAPASDLPTP
jgi:hypothetical protein